MSDEDVHVSHRVPEDIRDEAQNRTNRGEISEAVRRVYRNFARGEAYPGHAQHEAERVVLERMDDRLQEYQDEMDETRRAMQERIEELEEEKEQRDAARDEYEGRLRELEELVRSGSHVDPEHGAVLDAAECSARPPSRVIEELKQRNPDIPDYAFQPADEADGIWDGTTGDAES